MGVFISSYEFWRATAGVLNRRLLDTPVYSETHQSFMPGGKQTLWNVFVIQQKSVSFSTCQKKTEIRTTPANEMNESFPTVPTESKIKNIQQFRNNERVFNLVKLDYLRDVKKYLLP